MSVSDKKLGIALEAYDQQQGYSKIEKMRDALNAVASTEAAFTRYNGMIFIAHPDIPVHFWDGKTMRRLDEASK